MGENMTITWTVGPDLPENRKAGAVGTIEGKLVYVGGVGPMRPCTTAIQYDPLNSEYESFPGPVKPPNRCNGVSAAGGFFITGATGFPAGAPTTECYRLSRESPDSPLAWHDLPGLLYPSMGAGAAASDTLLFCSPSWYSLGKVQARMLDEPLREWFALPDHPNSGKCYEAVTQARGKFYLFGGSNRPEKKEELQCFNDAYCLDAKNERWERIADMPYGIRAADATCVADRYALIIGGASNSRGCGYTESFDNGRSVQGYLKDIVVYDIETDSYEVFEDSLPFGVANPAICSIDDTVYVVAGENRDRALGYASNYLQVGTVDLG